MKTQSENVPLPKLDVAIIGGGFTGAKGDLWESTAVPEIREQVHRLVEHLVSTDGFDGAEQPTFTTSLPAEFLIGSKV
jgi:hypothetical protein